jgi:lysophospholipase
MGVSYKPLTMKLYPTLENRLPEGSICHDVTTSDGVHLRALSVRQTRAKATIFILNGRAEYIERYFETINELMQRGFAVISFDWRGQGGSQRILANPLRGFIKNFSQYDKDLAAVIGLAGRLDYPEPFYALGHSTGGNILLRALRDQKWFKRAVLCSPLLGLHYGYWPVPIVRLLTLCAKVSGLSWAFLPGYAQGPMKRDDFELNPLTSDRGRWNRDIKTLEAHPELGIGGPTYGWLRAAMNSFFELHRWPKGRGPNCPTMIVIAGKDYVVDSRETRNFADHAPGFSLLSIDESRHEILMENNIIRHRFWAAFDAFMSL